MSYHPNFKPLEATRPDFDNTSQVHYTKTVDPDWKFGSGATQDFPQKHIVIDPHEKDRPANFNYKILISSIAPRPLAVLSTRSTTGAENVAPFSYFNMINHDPPLFIVGIVGNMATPKDTLRNLFETKECVINIVSEHFVEAANSGSMDIPFGMSEWTISGLTPDYSCETVKPPRVKEAIVSIEAKVESIKLFDSKATPGKQSGSLVVLEGTRFWVREDALNEEKSIVDPAVLKPVSRLGGITYGRTTQILELPKPHFERDLGGMEEFKRLQKAQKSEQ